MKKVIVVGAGIAGLTAAIYAQRSGLDVTVLEQHSIAGGMCTAWRRKGYLFEGAMHWLTGSAPGSDLNRLWREVGALDDSVQISTPEVFRTLEWEGNILHLYRSAEKTRDELLRNFPQDAKVIRRLYKDIKRLCALEMPVTDIKGLKAATPSKMRVGDILQLVPALPAMGRLTKQSAEEYLSAFSAPAARLLLSIVPENYTANSLVFTLATLDKGDGGFPAGGSLPFIQRMAQTFCSLGGELRLGCRAEKVLSENGRATGVQLAGETLHADAVIIAAETKAAVGSLFDTPLDEAWLAELCQTAKPAVCTFVGIGLRVQLAETPAFVLDEPIRYADRIVTTLDFNNYSLYPGQAPEGGTTLTAILPGDTYDYWKGAKTQGSYESEKRRLAEAIETALCAKWPQLAGKIDVIDIATPLTYERYTSAHHGAWMSVTEPGDRMQQYPGYLANVQGLYFASHRLMPPGGLPGALATGRTAAQLVCRQFDVVFQ